MVTVAVDVSTTVGSRFRSASTTNTCAGNADHAHVAQIKPGGSGVSARSGFNITAGRGSERIPMLDVGHSSSVQETHKRVSNGHHRRKGCHHGGFRWANLGAGAHGRLPGRRDADPTQIVKTCFGHFSRVCGTQKGVITGEKVVIIVATDD